MREKTNFISVFISFCCKTLKIFTFCHKTYVTFCREMLKYGTFCHECHQNLNIRAMRILFWIKSGCKEAAQVVLAWLRVMPRLFASTSRQVSSSWLTDAKDVMKRKSAKPHTVPQRLAERDTQGSVSSEVLLTQPHLQVWRPPLLQAPHC